MNFLLKQEESTTEMCVAENFNLSKNIKQRLFIWKRHLKKQCI